MINDDAGRRSGKKHKSAKHEASAPAWEPGRKKSAEQWSTLHLVLVLVGGLTVGAVSGYHARGGVSPSQEAAAPAAAEAPAIGPVANAAPAAAAPNADKFGRAPGDEHFGHDHPPEGAAAPAAPAGSGPDSFGRAPGSEHYGHNHQ